jgi:hypothetical protein
MDSTSVSSVPSAVGARQDALREEPRWMKDAQSDLGGRT